MKAPNPLAPHHMSPAERRAELCRILARGLVRLRLRSCDDISGGSGESSLHFPPDRSGHANPERRRDA